MSSGMPVYISSSSSFSFLYSSTPSSSGSTGDTPGSQSISLVTEYPEDLPQGIAGGLAEVRGEITQTLSAGYRVSDRLLAPGSGTVGSDEYQPSDSGLAETNLPSLEPSPMSHSGRSGDSNQSPVSEEGEIDETPELGPQGGRFNADSPEPWKGIGDGSPVQVICKGEVRFIGIPEWFLVQGHPLGKTSLTREAQQRCLPEIAEALIISRPPVDWQWERPLDMIPTAFTKNLADSVYEFRSRYSSEDAARELNQELITKSHRARKGCHIASFGGGEAPDLFYTDGRGFLLAECVLRGTEIDFPFHDAEMGVLNLLNICPIQLGANGWRMLHSFILRCIYEGVEPTVPLFFFFFHSGWQARSFVSFHRRPHRPQILEPCVSHPKGWQERFVLIRGDDGVRPWWVREEDDRPKFPLRWRRPRTGVRVSDWEDLTVRERLGVLRLVTRSPTDPEGIPYYRMMLFFHSCIYRLLSIIFPNSLCACRGSCFHGLSYEQREEVKEKINCSPASRRHYSNPQTPTSYNSGAIATSSIARARLCRPSWQEANDHWWKPTFQEGEVPGNSFGTALSSQQGLQSLRSAGGDMVP